MRAYPLGAAARDRFVLDRRPARTMPHDAWRAHAVVCEPERAADGWVDRIATVFLTGRECPWRCVMCDLWQHTIATDTPAGAIAAQVTAARTKIKGDPVTVMKLYNAGSFFDPRAVPDGDYDAIAASLTGLRRVIVESHPSLVGERTERFLAALRRHAAAGEKVTALEVAMGLETVHPGALEQMNKRMTIETFAQAAARLHRVGVSVRVFLLVSPPFIAADRQDEWLLRSVHAAAGCGATAISLIPTRGGNGALEALAADGAFQPPTLDDLERSVALALGSVADDGGPLIFADIWDLERFASCAWCLEHRRARLHAINLAQRVMPQSVCLHCGSGPAA